MIGCGILLYLSTPIQAQTATQPNGSGTSQDPYLIASLENLYWLSTNPTQWDKSYEQTANIDASATSNWTVDLEFSTQGGNCFMGGQYPAVSGNPVYGTTNFYVSISNIGSQYSSFTVDLASGGTVAFYAYYADTWGINTGGTSETIACGSSYSFATTSTGFMPIGNINTKFTGSYDGAGYSITNLSISRDAPAFTAFDGTGLFGRTSGATIENIRVHATTVSGEDLVGVLAGDIENTTISQATIEATTVSGNQYVGGLAGAASGTLTLTESGSKVTNVNASFAHAGGLIGVVETANTLIENCYARADVSTNGAYSGGLFAQIETTGGTLEFRNCYAEGDISVGTRTFAIDVAHYVPTLSTSTTVENLLMDTTNDPVNSLENISTGKTAAQMKTLSTYTDADWDFSTVWAMDAAVNDGYPYLNNQAHATIGGSGFRLLGVPSASATYADILAETWTQGSTNADVSAGSANVWSWDGSAWTAVSDLSTTPSAGQGFLSYVFSDPDYDQGNGALPVVLSTSENFYSTDQSVSASTNDGTAGTGWSLISNPFDAWISVDELFNGRNSNFSTNAYVYDPDSESYQALSGADGNTYYIAPYQGFFVQDLNDGTDAGSFSLPIAAKTSQDHGVFYKSRPNIPIPKLSFYIEHDGQKEEFIGLNLHDHASANIDAMDGLYLSPLQAKSGPFLAWKLRGDADAEGGLGGQSVVQNFIPSNGVGVAEYELDATWINLTDGQASLEKIPLTLGWTFESWPENHQVYLIDQLTGSVTLLNTAEQYQFESEEGDFPNPQGIMVYPARETTRFKIRIEKSEGVFNELVSENEADPKTNYFEVFNNYPNPFNPRTQLSYRLDQQAQVGIQIFNALGQMVQGVPVHTRAAGRHTYIFDANLLPSGVYYYSISIDNEQVIQPMLLIK